MSIKVSLENDTNFKIDIDNGDLKALNDAVEKWNFADKVSAIRFAIAILSLTENGTLCREKDGNKLTLTPQDSLLKRP